MKKTLTTIVASAALAVSFSSLAQGAGAGAPHGDFGFGIDNSSVPGINDTLGLSFSNQMLDAGLNLGHSSANVDVNNTTLKATSTVYGVHVGFNIANFAQFKARTDVGLEYWGESVSTDPDSGGTIKGQSAYGLYLGMSAPLGSNLSVSFRINPYLHATNLDNVKDTKGDFFFTTGTIGLRYWF